MKYKVEIESLGAMLQHRFSEDILTTPSKKSKDKKLTEKEKRAIAEQYLYLEKGKPCVPANHLEGAMQKASTNFKFQGKTSYKEIIKGATFVFPEYIPIKAKGWEVDSRAIVNPSTRGRSMCYRPRFEKWSLGFTIEVNDDRADGEVVRQILEHAGLYKSIGAYRPRFGRFVVKKFKKA